MTDGWQYTFDHRIANCDGCALQPMRQRSECLAQRPKGPESFSGLMFVGEGPGETEANVGVPFVGAAGQLFDKLLQATGIDRDQSIVSNATLCLPDPTQDKAAQLRSGVWHCRARLFAEIQMHAPKVIVALGGGAMDALVGYEEQHNKREKYDCGTCGNERTWKRWRCAKCELVYDDQPVIDKTQKPSERTPCCGGKWQPRKVVCAECGGYKSHVVTTTQFKSGFKITEVAGGVWCARDLELGRYLDDPDNTYVLATYHPSYCLRKASNESGKKQVAGQFAASVLYEHLVKAKRILQSGTNWAFDWFRPQSADEAQAYLQSATHHAVDIETDHKDPAQVGVIRCIGFHGFGLTKTMVVPSDETASPEILQVVYEFLQDPVFGKVFQNGTYDVTTIRWRWGFWVLGWDGDTLAAHHALHPDEPQNLAHIGFKYTDVPPWKPPKDTGTEQFSDADELHEYNALDCKVTADSLSAMEVELEQQGVSQIHDLDVRKMRMAVAMTDYGMPVDRKEMLRIQAEAQYEMERALRELRQEIGVVPERIRAKADKTGGIFNPNSIFHLRWLLYAPDGPLKLTATKYSDRTGEPSTEEAAIRQFSDRPLVRKLLDYREGERIYNMVSGSMPVSEIDGRMRFEWKACGTVTGRFSSSPNAQNVPKWARSMVTAPEGRTFIGADFSQLELRIAAALSGDEHMIGRLLSSDEARKLEPDFDLHSFIAAIAFGSWFTDLALDDPNHDKTNPRCNCQKCMRKALRDSEKRVIYGLGYGAQAPRLREVIYDAGYDGPPLSIDMIQQIIDAIYGQFPDFRAFMEGAPERAQRRGYVHEPLLGRYREFPLGEIDAPITRNHPIQSSAAAVMDIGMWNFYCRLCDPDDLYGVDPTAGMMGQVHDALYTEAAEECAEPIRKAKEETLSCEIQLVEGGPWMPLPASAEIADNWKDVG